MDIVIEILIELAIEIFGEGFLSLSRALVPSKTLSKRTEKVLTVIFSLVGFCMLSLLFIGVIMLVDGEEQELGVIFTSISAAYVTLTAILSIIAFIKRRKAPPPSGTQSPDTSSFH